MKRLISIALLCLAGWQSRTLAHGVDIAYEATEAIQIVAAFDTGDPMVEAQVSVFSPEDPSTPWLTGTTDQTGRFVFAPDRSIAGNWEVQVRQAGHGDILTIPVGASESQVGQANQAESEVASRGHRLTLPQKSLMAASVIWGFIGTALFFAARKQ